MIAIAISHPMMALALYQAARRLLLRSNQACVGAFGANDPRLLVGLSNLAVVEQALGNLPEAKRLVARAIEITTKHFGADHPDLANLYSALARVQEELGDSAEAARLNECALKIEATLVGAGKVAPGQFAQDLNQHAIKLRKLGNFEQAASELARAIEIEDSVLPPEYPKRAHRRNNLAIVQMLAGRLPQARRTADEARLLKGTQHDVTSGRILFTQLALGLLQQQDVAPSIGKCKTLFGDGKLACYGGIARHWNATDILDNLKLKLSADAHALLLALVAALNDAANVPALNAFPEWRDQPALPLDEPG